MATMDPDVIIMPSGRPSIVGKEEVRRLSHADRRIVSTLQTMAPTGIDSPPESVRIGKNKFYYYGPGGGGVSYPDGYYFNLHGKILVIDFDGPYENDKTPTPETKKMELKVLASFREF
jgi:hypothetical protein